MANPPITIGPFANVPAPGSPIRSDWAQQVTQYVVNRGRGVLAVVNGPPSDQAVTVAAGTVDIGGLTMTFGAEAGRWYRIRMRLNLYWASGGASAAIAQFPITDGAGAVQELTRVTFAVNGSQITLNAFLMAQAGATGSLTRKARVSTDAGTVTIFAGGAMWLEDLGTQYAGGPTLFADPDAEGEP